MVGRIVEGLFGVALVLVVLLLRGLPVMFFLKLIPAFLLLLLGTLFLMASLSRN